MSDAKKIGRPKGAPSAKTPRVKAKVLVEAEFSTDAAVAAKWTISERTIQRWRAEAINDPEVAGEVARLHRQLDRAWRGSLVKTITKASERAAQLIPQIGADAYRDLLATVEVFGDVLVQSDAMGHGADEDDDDAEAPGAAEGAPAAETADAARSREAH